jgi:apolipoprotein N-acyltransferase
MARWRVLLPVAAGAGAGAGQAPLSLVWPAVAALIAAAILVGAAPTWRAAFRRGWLAGVGYFGVTLFWIAEPFLVEPERHGWMAPFAVILMVGGMALFWGMAGTIAAALGRDPAGRAFAFGLSLAAVDLGRTHVLTGFPWALTGYIWTERGLIQWASVAGIHGVTLLTTLAAGTAAAAVLMRSGRWRWLAVLPPAILLALDLAGAARVPPPGTPPGAPVVRIVQPNADQRLKWDPGWAQVFYDRQVALTAAGDDGAPPPDLILWPESALPTLLDQSGDLLTDIRAAAGDADVILGITRADDLRYHNSAILLGPDGPPVVRPYDKHHLVPFGEYIPFGDLLARVGIGAFAARFGFGFTPGPGPDLMDVGGRIGHVLPLICYEAIFPAHARMPAGSPDRPSLLVQLTNDAWFGTVAGPWQHLAQARVRAIEQGLPLARSANTGISAMVDPWGRVTHSLPLGVEGRIDAPLPDARPATPYARRGDGPVLVALALLLLGLSRVARARPVDPAPGAD